MSQEIFTITLLPLKQLHVLWGIDMSKRAVLFLIAVLAASNLLMVGSVFAQSIPKPTVPEFTLKFVAHPYDVPPTYGIDPDTGKNVTITEGYHVLNKTIEVTIRNQPSNAYSLYYNVSMKGHYENDWTYIPDSAQGYPASNSDYTVITISEYYSRPSGIGKVTDPIQIDFRVEALLGYYTRIPGDYVFLFGQTYHDVFTGKTSSWSTTQTLTLTQISILSPKAENYTVSDIPLNFTVDNPTLEIKYSLDNQEKVTITGNTTLTGLSNGLHNLTVYTMDNAWEVGTSEAISFNVEAPQIFPIIPVTAGIATAVTLVAVSLIYFKKRKH